MMNLLPPEIIEKIIHNLSFVQIMKCASVNHQLKKVINGYLHYHKYRKTITDALVYSAKNNDVQFISNYTKKYGSIQVVIDILLRYGTLFVIQTLWHYQVIYQTSKVTVLRTENEKMYWSMLDRLALPFLEWMEETNHAFPKAKHFNCQNPDVIKWLVQNGHYSKKVNDVYLFKLGLIDLAKEFIEKNIIKLDYPHYLLNTFDPAVVEWCLKYFSGNGNFLFGNDLPSYSDSERISWQIHPDVIRYLVFEHSFYGQGFMDLACTYGQEDVIDKLLVYSIKHKINANILEKYYHDKLFIKYIEIGYINIEDCCRYLIKLNRTDLIIKKALKNPRTSNSIIYQLIEIKQYDLVHRMITCGCVYEYEYISKRIELIDIFIEHPKKDDRQILKLLLNNGITMLKKWFPKLNRSKIRPIKTLHNYAPEVVSFLIKKNLIYDLSYLKYYIDFHINHLKLISTYIRYTNCYSILDKCEDEVLLEIMKKIPIPISCEIQWKRYDQIMARLNE